MAFFGVIAESLPVLEHLAYVGESFTINRFGGLPFHVGALAYSSFVRSRLYTRKRTNDDLRARGLRHAGPRVRRRGWGMRYMTPPTTSPSVTFEVGPAGMVLPSNIQLSKTGRGRPRARSSRQVQVDGDGARACAARHCSGAAILPGWVLTRVAARCCVGCSATSEGTGPCSVG
jgi:hypothetical protein